MSVAYLALGSNLGDRYLNLTDAVGALNAHNVHVLRTASIFETEPLGLQDQPWFLNTVVETESELQPTNLLHTCLSIEREYGRVREIPGGPRTLDIDIIFYDDRIIRMPNLTVPHPQFRFRRFVLQPLNEIAGNVLDPESGQTVAQILQETTDTSSIRRFGDPLIVS